ncbi:hypothetical protein [Microbulbifer sp. 2205BS26-8]|uniref:hypothetical protein n=1 Tax=Microbulbifer sp. 2205BS26-8 TaxID=3064386 RepID=UPI00273DE4DE|nr:hypothetical protein [Microbulbifer sp. 2205BS26-8]MDP5208348.1 hypothetical protein [Microbulbifer sp. 2205BS26-8]
MTAVFTLGSLPLGPVFEPLLVLLITVAGCLLLHELLIRRVPLLRLLFGLKPLTGKCSPAADSLAQGT